MTPTEHFKTSFMRLVYPINVLYNVNASDKDMQGSYQEGDSVLCSNQAGLVVSV